MISFQVFARRGGLDPAPVGALPHRDGKLTLRPAGVSGVSGLGYCFFSRCFPPFTPGSAAVGSQQAAASTLATPRGRLSW